MLTAVSVILAVALAVVSVCSVCHPRYTDFGSSRGVCSPCCDDCSSGCDDCGSGCVALAVTTVVLT